MYVPVAICMHACMLASISHMANIQKNSWSVLFPQFINILEGTVALMVSALDSGWGGLGSSLAGALHCVLGQDT